MAWMMFQQTHVEPAQRMSWNEICRRDDLRGRWVALDQCEYDECTGHAVEGALVDSDSDLATLCQRISESPWKGCAILLCKDR